VAGFGEGFGEGFRDGEAFGGGGGPILITTDGEGFGGDDSRG